MLLFLKLALLFPFAFCPAYIALYFGFNKLFVLGLMIMGIVGYILLAITIIKKNRANRKNIYDKYPLIKEFKDNGAKGYYIGKMFIYIDLNRKKILFEGISKGNRVVDFNQIERIEFFTLQGKKRSVVNHICLLASAFDENTSMAEHLVMNELAYTIKCTYHIVFHIRDNENVEVVSKNARAYKGFFDFMKNMGVIH